MYTEYLNSYLVDFVNNLLKVPEPVFFCSIEPPSLAYQKKLDLALLILTKEDPSISVHTNEETGQTVVAGMGELHLEVLKVKLTYPLIIIAFSLYIFGIL